MCAASHFQGIALQTRLRPPPLSVVPVFFLISIMPSTSRSRIVLVTGGARRLGCETALLLARAGWRVALHCRHSQAQARETVQQCIDAADAPDCCAIFTADLADENAARQLVPQVVAHFGALDAVVNNAAQFAWDDAASFSYGALESHLRSNTAAPVLLARALHAHIEARVAGGEDGAEGVVVNMLDQKLHNPNPDFFSYTLSKAALEAAGTLLALALAPRVRVVGVAPGLTLRSPWIAPERFAALHALSPLGRASSALDVATAVRFALENRAITGTTLLVDGGQHLQHFARDFSMM